MTPAELYDDVRERISALVRDLPGERLATPVPGCPGWTVRDVVAHATGVVADVVESNLDGVATDPWTDAQVAARRERPIGEVLDEWAEKTPRLALDDAPKGLSRTLLIDLVTHEHDIRGALREPGGRDCEAYEIARKGFAVALAKKLDERDLPGLRLESGDGWQFDAGANEPRHTVRAKDSFEFFRGLAGRRGRAQVEQWEWSTDPAPYLPCLNHFGSVPDDDVTEG